MKLAIREYITPQGNPFRVWLKSLDIRLSGAYSAESVAIENGNLGDIKM
jgi:hypothetical protein